MNTRFDFDSFMLGCIVGACALAVSFYALHYFMSMTPLDLGIPV